MREETYSEGTGTPWGTTADLRMVGENGESVLIAQRNEDHSVVDKGRHGVRGSDFLSTTLGTGGDENTDVFACGIIRKIIIKDPTHVESESKHTVKGTLCPEAASSVDECLPLAREVTITSGDTKEEGVVFRQLVGFDDGVPTLLRGVHFCKNVGTESLGDPMSNSATNSNVCSGNPARGNKAFKNSEVDGKNSLEDGGFSPGLSNTLGFLFGKLGDMLVQRVDDDTDFRGHCCCLFEGCC